MRPVKGWTMAGIALAVGVGTYGLLEILAPHRQQQAQLEGLAPVDSVFGDDTATSVVATAQPSTPASATAAPAVEPATPAPQPAAVTEAAPKAAPAEAPVPPPPAPAPPVSKPAAAAAAPDTANKPPAKAELAREAPPQAKPEPAPARQPQTAKPAAVATAKPPEAKPEPKAAPAAKPVVQPAPEPATAWWAGAVTPGGFQVLYVGSASFRRAIVVLTNGAPVDVESANRHLAVLDGSGRSIGGAWEISSANAGMLIFPLTAAGRYELIVGGQLGDRQARTLGQTLRGPVQIQ